MTAFVRSIGAEYQRYKALAEGAIRQLMDAELSLPAPGGGNSIAVLVWHISGNLASRFTDFLRSDGEKPWRDRDAEFAPRAVTSAELLQKWEDGWSVLFGALDGLTDEQLAQSVTIRGQAMKVHEALHRSLAHASYHVGQIVFLAKSLRGESWQYMSIPPGKSAEYNQNPTMEKAPNPPTPKR